MPVAVSAQQASQGEFKVALPERFGQHHVPLELGLKSRLAEAGRKEKGDSPRPKFLGDGRRALPTEVDVEDRRVEPFVRDDRQRLSGVANIKALWSRLKKSDLQKVK